MRNYFLRPPSWVQRWYPKAIWQTKEGPLWTIDDGPDPRSTPAWLDYLEEIEETGIFFLLGKQIEKHPHLVDKIISRGHEIGCHGYDHLDGWKTDLKTYLADVERAMTLMDTKLFRPPYGRMTRAQHLALSQSYTIVMWSLMPGDFDPMLSSEILQNRLSQAKKQDIIVMHDHPGIVQKLNTSKILSV